MDAKTKPTVSPQRAKFIELAQARMNRAIRAIRLVGQLDRRKAGYDAADVNAMVEALGDELEEMRKRLVMSAEGEPDFQLGAQHEGGEG